MRTWFGSFWSAALPPPAPPPSLPWGRCATICLGWAPARPLLCGPYGPLMSRIRGPAVGVSRAGDRHRRLVRGAAGRAERSGAAPPRGGGRRGAGPGPAP